MQKTEDQARSTPLKTTNYV